ncbi:MAG TPA: STAS domain-containing protein [Micromonosporaceae bacterium]
MSTPAAMSLTITRREQEQRPVLVLVGELDAATAPQFAAVALEIVDQAARDVIVDTSGLTLCDSSGLSVFVQVAGRLRAQAGRLAIVAPSPPVSQALELGGLADAFVVAPSVAAALYAIHRDHP